MDFLNLPTIFAAPRKVFLDCCWEARIGAPIYRIRGRHHHVCTAGILVSVQARIRVRRLAALSKHLLIPSTCNGPYLGKLGNIPFDSLSPIDHVEPAWCCWNSQRTQTVASRVDVSGKLGWQEKSNSCFREKKTIPAWIDAFENFIESLLGTQHRYGHSDSMHIWCTFSRLPIRRFTSDAWKFTGRRGHRHGCLHFQLNVCLRSKKMRRIGSRETNRKLQLVSIFATFRTTGVCGHLSVNVSCIVAVRSSEMFPSSNYKWCRRLCRFSEKNELKIRWKQIRGKKNTENEEL